MISSYPRPRLHISIDVQSLPARCELDWQFGVQIFRQKDIVLHRLGSTRSNSNNIQHPRPTTSNNYSPGIPSFLFRFHFRLWLLQWRYVRARFGSQSAREVQGHRSGMWCQAAPWFLGDTESQGVELEWLVYDNDVCLVWLFACSRSLKTAGKVDTGVSCKTTRYGQEASNSLKAPKTSKNSLAVEAINSNRTGQQVHDPLDLPRFGH